MTFIDGALSKFWIIIFIFSSLIIVILDDLVDDLVDVIKKYGGFVVDKFQFDSKNNLIIVPEDNLTISDSFETDGMFEIIYCQVLYLCRIYK